jgi:uncharacterized iron-regulated protein
MKLLASLTLLLAATAGAHPLDGRIWDTRSGSFISAEAAYDRAAASPYVLLGEKHDSDAHHRLQLEALQALAQRGRKPALALEQFDREHQPALSAAQAAGAKDAEQLADAGQLNRKGWRWPMYKDMIAFAAGQGWPLIAANLSRSDAREIAMGKVKPALPPAGAAQATAMENEIVQGHCGQRPPQDRLDAIVLAQRARDARMAEALVSASGPVVLIAGAGHVRRDRAVPRYLQDGERALSIAYVEVSEGQDTPQAYDAAGFDLLWFTPRMSRTDACAKPLTGSVAPIIPPSTK